MLKNNFCFCFCFCFFLLQGFLLENLKSIDLNRSLSITIVPDLGAPNLEELDISYCENLIEIHEAIGSLEKLKYWNLEGCKKLQILPSSFRLKSLENIYLDDCVSLETLPDLCAPNLRALNINYCENLIEIHEAIGSLEKLKCWNLKGCKKLQILPSSFRLKSLEKFCLDDCVGPETLPDLCAPNLRELYISDCKNLIEIHEAFGSLDKLKCWNLERCKKLQILPSSFRLKSLEGIYLDDCVSLETLPDLCAPNLKYLDISYCENLIEVYGDIGSLDKLKHLNHLEELDISYCENLIEVHVAIGSLDKLKCLNLNRCKKLQILPSSFRMKSLECIYLIDCVSLETLPDLCAPNLKHLNIGDCKNLIEIHEAFGSLDKLVHFEVYNCKKLQILPNTLRLKSLVVLSLNGCVSLEKFPNIHPGMKCNVVNLSDCNIKEWPLSVGYLFSELPILHLDNYQSLGDFPVGILRWKFTNLGVLSMKKCDGNIIEHILMKPDSFPLLRQLYLDDSNIVTIPRSIIRFTTLQELSMTSCKNLREIPRLPQSIQRVYASGCTSLDLRSSCRLLNQVSSLPPLSIRVIFR